MIGFCRPVLLQQLLNALLGKRIRIVAVHCGAVSSKQHAGFFCVNPRRFSNFHIVDFSTCGHDA